MIDRTLVLVIFIFNAVCLSFFHHYPFYRSRQRLTVLSRVESNLYQDSFEIGSEADRILQHIHKSPRNMMTIDVLRSLESNSSNNRRISSSRSSYVNDDSNRRVNVSDQVLLEVMTRLVERRDHVRFGDMLSVYAVKKYENTDTNWEINGSSKSTISYFLDSNSNHSKYNSSSGLDITTAAYSDENSDNTKECYNKDNESSKRRKKDSNIQIDQLVIADDHNMNGKKFRNVSDKKIAIIDMDILMLLVISVQRMKVKKRQPQSLELLQKVLLSEFHHKIVNTFVLSMIVMEKQYVDDKIELIGYKNSIATILNSNRNITNGNKMNVIDFVDRTESYDYLKNEIIHQRSLDFKDMDSTDFVPSNIFLLGIISTPLWSSVKDIIVEYKQHPSWNKEYRDLNVNYYLSLINAVVEDKKLGIFYKFCSVMTYNLNSYFCHHFYIVIIFNTPLFVCVIDFIL